MRELRIADCDLRIEKQGWRSAIDQGGQPTMLPRQANDAGGPTREELAAYADGELRGAAHARVQVWLAAHPEAAGEVVSLRQLGHLYRASTPADPGAAAWTAMLDRIERE